MGDRIDWIVEVNEVRINLYGGSRRDLWQQFTEKPGIKPRLKVAYVSLPGNLVHIGRFTRADATEFRDFIATFIHKSAVRVLRHTEWKDTGDMCACSGGDRG